MQWSSKGAHGLPIATNCPGVGAFVVLYANAITAIEACGGGIRFICGRICGSCINGIALEGDSLDTSCINQLLRKGGEMIANDSYIPVIWNMTRFYSKNWAIRSGF